VLTWRRSAPPLPEEPPLNIHPSPVEGIGTAEPFDLDDRVRMVDHQLIPVPAVHRTYFAPDHTVCSTEKTNHVPTIGTEIPGNRGQNWALNVERQIDRQTGSQGGLDD